MQYDPVLYHMICKCLNYAARSLIAHCLHSFCVIILSSFFPFVIPCHLIMLTPGSYRIELPKVPKVQSAEADCYSNAIKITWQKPDGEISGYRLTCDPKKGSKSDKKELKLESPDELSATFDDLISETDYVIKIFSVHEGRESDRVKVAAKTSKCTYVLLLTSACTL